jgi:hypothetical protein
MISQAEIHVEVDGTKPFNDLEMILLNTEKLIKSNIPNMDTVLVVPHANLKSSKS